jgi:hypothetical protein
MSGQRPEAARLAVRVRPRLSRPAAPPRGGTGFGSSPRMAKPLPLPLQILCYAVIMLLFSAV